MNIRDLVRLAGQSLFRNKGRAALTMSGMIIGVASVMMMMSVGTAAQSFLLSQVASFGSDLIIITNGRGDVKRGDPSQLVKQTLTEQDFQRLQSSSWVRASTASLISSDQMEGGDRSIFGQVVGTAPDEPALFNSQVASGRFLNDDEVSSRARVIVLGAGIAEKLYGETSPIGQQVRINRRPFRVIGVMEHGGTRFFSELDKQAYVPFTSALDLYNKERVNFISFKAQGIGVEESKRRVRDLFRQAHHIINPRDELAKDDFRVLTQEDAIRNAGMIGTILQILLVSIAAISLLVGGIGIMNIMFVAVTERTREIGLRKAVGAFKRDILGQFLAEALILTCTGGVIGVLFGALISFAGLRILATFQSGWTFHLPVSSLALGFGVSVGVGVLFGYMPARKAASLNPIEALR